MAAASSARREEDVEIAALPKPRCLPVSPFELFARAEAVPVERPVHRQNSIQVIDLVLQQLGERAFGVDRLCRAGFIHVAHTHPFGAFQPDQQIGEGEAIVPHTELLLALEFELRIAQPVGASANLDIDQAAGFADLHRADAAAESMRALEFVEGGAEVFEHRLRIVGGIDGRGDGPQQRVA